MAVTPNSGATHAVQQTRSELADWLADYELIDDCVRGQRAIKDGTTKYLPNPDTTDVKSIAAQSRYSGYVDRAVFYNVAQRTLSGLVGEVFAREPTEELPSSLEVVAMDANGGGMSLTQLAKRATRLVLAKGRAGMLADYPQTGNKVSKADVQQGKVQPTISLYDAKDIINWRTERVGAKLHVTLVVLKEHYDDFDDGFIVSQKEQHRVLRLVDGVYTSIVYRDGVIYSEEVRPTSATGKTFDSIPFVFIGAENNDVEIDHAPLLDLCNINVAHYRNSADFEEAVFMVGQPTPVFAGLEQAWVKEVMKGKVRLGSRGGVMLPQGGTAELLQMQENGAAFAAMEHKERQMVSLGAKLIEQKEVQRTATEANIENAGETSVLASVAKNVGSAIQSALVICGLFQGGPETEIVYELNTDFSSAHMDATDRAQLVSEWQQGVISYSETRAALKKAGVATLDDDEAMREISEDDFRNDPNAEDETEDEGDGSDNGEVKEDDE